jgi:alpha-D-ribose 1-methylphosphonate 5-triphosphate synthase subunit PhnG
MTAEGSLFARRLYARRLDAARKNRWQHRLCSWRLNDRAGGCKVRGRDARTAKLESQCDALLARQV